VGNNVSLPCKARDMAQKKKRLCMLNLGNAACAPWNLFNIVSLTQMGNQFLWQQNVSEKNQKHILFLGSKNVSATMFRVHINGKTFRETCFCNNVSSTMIR